MRSAFRQGGQVFYNDEFLALQPLGFCISSGVAVVALLGLEVITLESVLVVALYQTKNTELHIFQLVKENGLILDSEYSGVQFFL